MVLKLRKGQRVKLTSGDPAVVVADRGGGDYSVKLADGRRFAVRSEQIIDPALEESAKTPEQVAREAAARKEQMRKDNGGAAPSSS